MDISGHSAEKPSNERHSGFFRRLSLGLMRSPNAVIALFGAYFLLQVVVRQIIPPALRIDEAQQILFSQWLALGYDAQPPLYNWYQQAVFALLGTSMATLAFAKNLILFLTFAVFVKTAERVLEDKRLVAVAAMALFVIPQVFWQAQRDLTHTAMFMLTFSLLLYCSIRLLQRPTTMGYLLVGLIAGLGMLSKYNFALALPAVLFAVMLHPQGRSRIFDRRFLLTIAVSIIVFLPHIFWLIDNLAFASEVTLKRMAEDAPESRALQIGRGLGRFIAGSLIIIAIPTALLALASKGKLTRSATHSNPWLRFFLHYFIAIATLMAIVILMTTMTELRDRWLLPLLLPFPILAALFLGQRLADIQEFAVRFLPVPLIMLALIPVAMLLAQPLTAARGRASSSNYDWQAFQRHIAEKEGISPSVIVTPDWPSGGNLRFVFPQVPVATTIYNDYDPPFKITDEHPALLVWTGDDDSVAELSQWVEGQLNLKVKTPTRHLVDLPHFYPIKDRAVRYNYAVVTPNDLLK